MNFRLTVFSRSQSLNIKSYFVFSITHFITLIFFFRISLTRESGKTWIQMGELFQLKKSIHIKFNNLKKAHHKINFDQNLLFWISFVLYQFNMAVNVSEICFDKT